MQYQAKVAEGEVYLNARRIKYKHPILEAEYEEGVIVAVTEAGDLIGLDRRGRRLWKAKRLGIGDQRPAASNPFGELWRDRLGRLYVITFQDIKAYIDATTGGLMVFV